MLLMVDTGIFRELIRYYSGWTVKPDTFIELILMVDHSMKPPISAGQSKSGRPSKAANLFAKAMIRELNINISPYRDFDELSKAYAFKFDIGRAMFEVNTAARLKEEYFAMLDNAAVIPAEELKIELAFQNLIEKIIGRLRPYADFR